MSVEVRYLVVREGKEVAMYSSKKEADAHDRMLDIALVLSTFIQKAESVHMDEEVLEELCVYLSKNRDELIQILKGGQISGGATRIASESAQAPVEGRPRKKTAHS